MNYNYLELLRMLFSFVKKFVGFGNVIFSRTNGATYAGLAFGKVKYFAMKFVAVLLVIFMN